MKGAEGHFSRDKTHIARLQRERRARLTRIDYMPNAVARIAIAAKRQTVRPGSVAATHSAILDAIISEWAELTGISYPKLEPPKSSKDVDQYARPRMTSVQIATPSTQPLGDPSGISRHIAHRRARGMESGSMRVSCGAKRHRDGLPCKAKSEPGKRRCRFHGGRSTGPKTALGRAKSLRNLVQFRAD